MSTSETRTILVTGGAGFIGSHTCVELLTQGYGVIIVDDLSNASPKVIDRIKTIVGDECAARLRFVKASILDEARLEQIFATTEIFAIIHFAGFKAVGESTRKPLEYYWNNVAGLMTTLRAARAHGVKRIIFSSSATVYGEPAFVPITEDCPQARTTNPYGETKAMDERILCDLYRADPAYAIVLLRYFNPIGAHESGLIGEDPTGIPNNLLPYVAQVAVGKLDTIHVYGKDYETADGTGVRDYIHVVDLAKGHVAALRWLEGSVGTGQATDAASIPGPTDEQGLRHGVAVFNLGTGTGSSVLEVIKAFEAASGRTLPYVIEDRRPGDIAENYAACSKAEQELGWRAEYDLARMCEDSWRWQSMNPSGYEA